MPSARKRSHCDSRGLVCRLPGSAPRRLVDDVIADAWTRAHAARLLGRAQHGAHDAVVRAAAAQVAVERVAHLGLAGVGIALEQRGGGDQDAGDAVAALHGLLGDEGALQRMRPLGRAEAFDRGDVLAGGGPQRRVAGGHRLAVDQHVAGAALVGAAAEMRGRQPQRRRAAR